MDKSRQVPAAAEAAGTFYFPLQEEMRYDKGVSDKQEVLTCTVKKSLWERERSIR